mgnify:CR=1 FL=1|jgi:hypothetical protein
MRNGGGGAQMGSAAFYIFGDSGQSYGWGIRVVGSLASLANRVVGAAHRGRKVQQRLRRGRDYRTGKVI